MFIRSDFAMWISSFGAEVTTNVTRRTTHVIANPDRKTTKVKRAARYPHIKIVNPEWMLQCCSRWEHVDETPYIIETDAAERSGSPIADPEDESVDGTGDEAADDAPHSPIVEMSNDDWAQLDDELADFMNETDTDGGGSESDSDSVRSENSTVSDTKQQTAKKKRKRTNSTDVSETENEESDSSVNSTTSRLQRRKKRTMERVTSLTNVVTADKSSGLPSPETTGPEEDLGDGDEEEKNPEANGVAPDLQEDYDDGLEAELLAGFGDSDGEE
jgi:RNA polymerase II subunit A-like phosphatase